MATTFYSDAVGNYRAKCTYSVSETNKEVTISGTLSLQHKGSAGSTYYTAIVGYGFSKSKTPDFITLSIPYYSTTSHSSWTDISSSTFKVTKDKERTSKTLYLSIGAYKGNYSPSPTVSGTVHKSISIAEKPKYLITYYLTADSPLSTDYKYYNEAYRIASSATRTGYVFTKWNTKSDGSGADYNPSASYTANTPLTLYAQWHAIPSISSLTAVRSNSLGEEDSNGDCALITCAWSISDESAVVTGKIIPDGESPISFTFREGSSGTGGTAIALISASNGTAIDTDTQYIIEVTATNSAYSEAKTSVNEILTRAYFVMDFKAGGKGVGIGRAAPDNGLEIGYEATFDEDVAFYKNAVFDEDVTFEKDAYSRGSKLIPESHIGRTLWTGSWDSGNITVPDTDKYTMFLVTMSGQGTVVPAIKYSPYIRGMGGYSSATPTITSYQFAATFSGDTWTFVACNSIRHNASSNHGAVSNVVVSSIIGLI